jgi:GH25 family lysozyme M1 (1,4-beta-N-acetylmuramidase)
VSLIVKVIAPLLALVAAAVVAWVRKRGQTAALPAGALASIAQQFLSAQPADRRDQVARWPVTVVLGERARAGASPLINTLVDWQAREKRFQPSLVAPDAPLRIYQGDGFLVHELAASLVQDEAVATREALLRLWSDLRARSVAAVVAVSADDLSDDDGAALLARAQLVRGKLDIVSQAAGAPVDVRLCVVGSGPAGDGFGALVQLLAGGRRGLAFGETDAAADALAAVLPLALQRLDGQRFAAVVTFLGRSGKFTANLRAFTAALALPPPAASALALFDPASGAVVNDPFPVVGQAEATAASTPARTHLVRCAALLSAALFPLGVVTVAGRAPARTAESSGSDLVPAAAATASPPAPAPPPDCPAPARAPAITLREVDARYAVGVDVSDYNGDALPWSTLRQTGVAFVFVRATEGQGEDRFFADHWKNARSCGLLRGAYHVFRFEDDPTLQARRFAARLLGDRGELPPTIDLEGDEVERATHDCAALDASLRAFSDALRAALGPPGAGWGATPMFYTSKRAWQKLACTEAFRLHPLWLAHYASESSIEYFGGWARWDFWQFSDSGLIGGDAVDVSHYHGTALELLARAGVPPPVGGQIAGASGLPSLLRR